MSGSAGGAGRRSTGRLSITRGEWRGERAYWKRGRRIRDPRLIARIDALAVPPAWTDVEIAASPRAKVQARGVDAAGRTQTIYHPAFRRRREREKFERMERFAARIPVLRARVDRDLRRRALGRERVVAGVVRMIDLGLIRVGNAEYTRRNGSYGATTLLKRHVSVTGTTVVLDFVGKSGERQHRCIRDARLARLVGRLMTLPGEQLFQCADGDGVQAVGSQHVNAYLQRHAGAEFSAKDFRTWGATRIAAEALMGVPATELRDPAARAAALRRIVRDVSGELGNTPAVTRASYIDPRVLRAVEDPELLDRVRGRYARRRDRRFFSRAEQVALELVSCSGRGR